MTNTAVKILNRTENYDLLCLVFKHIPLTYVSFFFQAMNCSFTCCLYVLVKFFRMFMMSFKHLSDHSIVADVFVE